VLFGLTVVARDLAGPKATEGPMWPSPWAAFVPEDAHYGRHTGPELPLKPVKASSWLSAD